MTKDEALKLALEALLAGDWYIGQLEMIVYSIDDTGTHENRAKVQTAITAMKAALAQPTQQDFHLHDEENEGGWTNWVCPKPDSYLMKCCDCGLVHEMQTRVAKYEPKPSEDFVVPNDPDLQTQFRVRRHEVLETTPAQRKWVGLTDPDFAREPNDDRFLEGAFWAEAKLKGKNL